MSAATAATHSSGSPRLAPSSESRSGITSAQDWLSQAARQSHTCRNWSPPNPDRPDGREFCPSYRPTASAAGSVDGQRHATCDNVSGIRQSKECRGQRNKRCAKSLMVRSSATKPNGALSTLRESRTMAGGARPDDRGADEKQWLFQQCVERHEVRRLWPRYRVL